MRTYVVGRSHYADIVLPDTSVARRHAEIVVTDDGRFHVTDCAGETGTWQASAADDGTTNWSRLRQAFVALDQPLRFGSHTANLRQLLNERIDEPRFSGSGRWRYDRGGETAPLAGRVERDPESGEIVRKRT